VNALEPYLVELRDIRASGGAVPETSGYGALATLLNDIGHHLKPRVRCFINLSDTGAGIPDGGLFVANQLQKGAEPLPGQVPQRGAIEVKAPSASAREVARGEQVAKYLQKYRQVLVTSYREFVLVGYDADGKAKPLESYSLASSEKEFWALASQPRKAAAAHGERLTDFLKRAMLRQAQIVAPQELAWFLASYAREARARVEEGGELPALVTTRQALEQALGMTFEGDRGEHFFRSTLVQTLFYGLFAAWVFWAEQHEPTDTQARFRWREAGWYLHIPILSKLYGDFASPSQLGTMHLEEVLDWAGEALDRVDRASFFSTFEQQHAVQYFYEPFLEAFDPELRKQLGVWYTPPEVVKYMVARVDQVLRNELNIADGLADPRVVVLDPCCGTGAYLVEVLDRIAETLHDKGGDALIANDLKKAAMSRVFGFEILPAPFVISHLQIGLALDRFGAPFSENGKERAGVYLTNALTGWEPPTEPKQHLLFSELEMERDAAADVKQKKPILVILGNPPYNGFAGLAVDEERDLVEAYRQVDKVAPPQGQGLNDLYVRFYRMAERRITEGKQGEGVVCFISNYSWLDGLSFTGMRERFLDVFDDIWIDCLNGDKYKTGKLTPEGEPDPSVFSTEHNREGIQVGTAIALLARRQRHTSATSVRQRQFWGTGKLGNLQQHILDESSFESSIPATSIGLSFTSTEVDSRYLDWPTVPELFPTSFPGVKTSRDDFVVDVDRERLESRMLRYFDDDVDDSEAALLAPSAMSSTRRFDAKAVRRSLVSRGFLPEQVVRYCYRPFDIRWLYWEPETKLLDEKRSEYFPYVFPGNVFIFTTGRTRKGVIEPAMVSAVLNDLNCMDSGARGFPLYLKQVEDALLLGDEAGRARTNASPAAVRYANAMGATVSDLFFSAVATMDSPLYRSENAWALRHDWPRIAPAASADALLASANVGRMVAALLDVESPVDRVTCGGIRFELRPIGPVAKADGGQIDPGADDLAVTAGWGHAGQGGVTMPGRGRLVDRAYTAGELAIMREGLGDLDLSLEQLMSCLGGSCVDVYLNERAYWRCVPSRVWTYTIGGYQVVKKWLSYRERPLLGRDLTVDEARYVTEMARRIAAILLLEPALDANYERVKADTYTWPRST
jgi:hypothetical protein